ncbi:leucine-rich repeat-containing protein 37B-like [Antechinus flavipes]|uniref:leucine-rich repeat-containing protein 37B-like n=1 Tax=Antechinus flavipes TaxID=38775 RepID=UPI002236372C|nr:leucine-rich repeat-containing protein 37B-like [Antechinus flavipes]
MSGRPLPGLGLSAFLLLALAAWSPLCAPELSGAERVTPASGRSGHRAHPGFMARALAVLPDPAVVRAALSRALALRPKVSDNLASPKPVSTLISHLPERASQTLPPPVTTQAPTWPPELSQTLPSMVLMPRLSLKALQIRATSSLVPAPDPLAPQTAASLVPAPTILSHILTSQIPAASLEKTEASMSTHIPAASLVPAKTLISPLISSLVPTQTLTSSPKSLGASFVVTQTSQLIQTLTPPLVPIQTPVSFLPLATPREHSPTTPTRLPILPQNLAVYMMSTQVFKSSQTSTTPLVHSATPTPSLVIPQTMAVLLVPAQTLVSPQSRAPTVKHTQIPAPLLQLPQTLPLLFISGNAPNQPPQALVPSQTPILPSVPQKNGRVLTSTEALTLAVVPPPELTIPPAPPPEPPPKPTKLYPPSPEMTKILLLPLELKKVPVKLLSVSMVEKQRSQTPGPPSLVLQKNIRENNSVCLGPCTCKAGTLSCTGLSPELRLHRIPVPGPKAHNLTFFSLDFHGNSISVIERGIWKSYPWAEVLNLKDNALHKLHKNTFEGLLSLQYLDLSCNKIHVIERRAFEPLPFLQFLNLGCNLLKELRYGIFQTWHGLQFFQKLILTDNPLSTIEDSFFSQLPSLKYLDISRTEVPLMTIENILVTALKLQTLVLPSNIACCLCQFKKNIESTFKTIKLQCESKCFTNSFLCDQKESIEDIQRQFTNTLQSRTKNSSIELNLQPEKVYIDSGIYSLPLLTEKLSSNGEIDLLDAAAKYLLPNLPKGKVKNIELKLLPFIKTLNTHLRNGEKTSSSSTTQTSWASFDPIQINLSDEIQLRKLYFVTNLLETYLREKMYYIKNKHEKHVKAKYPVLRKKWKTFTLERSKKCDEVSGKCSQPPASSERKAVDRGVDACKGQFCTKMKLVEIGKVRSSEKSKEKKHSEGTYHKRVQGKQESVRSSLKNIAKGRTRVLGQIVKRLRNQGWHPRVGSLSTANPLAATLEDRSKSDGLTHSITTSKNANKRPKYKAQKEKHGIGTAFQKDHSVVLPSNKNHIFHKTKSRIANVFPKTKQSQKVKNKLSQNRWLHKNPVYTEPRSLINNPSTKVVSLASESRMSAKTLKGSIPAKASERYPTIKTPSEKTTAASRQEEEVILDSSLSAVQPINKTHWKYKGKDKFLPKSKGRNSSNFSASPESFEMELNQRLQPLIPNEAMRNLISHVAGTLQKDCVGRKMQLACTKLISKTGLLMKLLSEQEKMEQKLEHQDSNLWIDETDLSDSTDLQKALGQLQKDEMTKDTTGFGYNNKLLLAISVTVVVMIIIAVICLIEICSHRSRTSKTETKHSFNLWRFLTSFHKKSSRKSLEEDGDVYKKGKPLWLKDMYRPLDATRKKNMAQKLRDQDSSDEDEIFTQEGRNEGKKSREKKK